MAGDRAAYPLAMRGDYVQADRERVAVKVTAPSTPWAHCY